MRWAGSRGLRASFGGTDLRKPTARWVLDRMGGNGSKATTAASSDGLRMKVTTSNPSAFASAGFEAGFELLGVSRLGVERDVAARDEGLNISEAFVYEPLPQPFHLHVPGADVDRPEERYVPRHRVKVRQGTDAR